MAIQAQLYSDSFGFSVGPENGCGFDNLCLTPQQFMQFQNHNFFVDNHAQFPLSAHIERQRQEMEQLIDLQNEQLRLALEQQRKQQEALLMKKYESRTRFLLLQKDEEIAKASNRMRELENLLKKMEMERQTWQRAARENESTVASLNGLIQRVRESVCLSENAAEDAQSCCPNAEQEKPTRLMICKCCNSRNSCVVMLPCRHLSSCQDCEVFLDSCPLCRMPKKASIHALL